MIANCRDGDLIDLSGDDLQLHTPAAAISRDVHLEDSSRDPQRLQLGLWDDGVTAQIDDFNISFLTNNCNEMQSREENKRIRERIDIEISRRSKGYTMYRVKEVVVTREIVIVHSNNQTRRSVSKIITARLS